MVVPNYTYGTIYTKIGIRLNNVKVTPSSSFRSVAFELHSQKNYKHKIYIEVSGGTFGYGEMPTNLTYKRRGDFYIHEGNGDPVSIRRLNGVLDEENRLILKGVCQFVTDPSNLEMIFDTAVKSSWNEAQEYWKKYRKRMTKDIRKVGQNCLRKLGGAKVVFVKQDRKGNSVAAGTRTKKKSSITLKELNNTYLSGSYNCSMTERGRLTVQIRDNKAVLIKGPRSFPRISTITEETSTRWRQQYDGITRYFSVEIVPTANLHDTLSVKSQSTNGAPCEIYLSTSVPNTISKKVVKSYASLCGLSPEIIKKAQIQLKRLDLYPFKVDGIAGKGTIAGIKKAKDLTKGVSSNQYCLTGKDINAFKALADQKTSGNKSTFQQDLAAKNLARANPKGSCQVAGLDIQASQERLKKLGYYYGDMDGLLGDQTRKSFLKFENFLGKELASEDGCLDKEELRWLVVIANAKRKGITCFRPSVDKKAFLSVQKFFKDSNLYEGQFPTQQSDIRSFTRAVIRLELEAETILGKSVKKNCQIDNSEKTLITANVNSKQNKKATDTLVSKQDQNTDDAKKDVNAAESNLSGSETAKEVKEEKVCSADDISKCLVKEICAQAVLTEQGVSTIRRDNNPFTEHLINQAKENTIDKICGFQNVLDMAEPNEMIIMIKDFLKINPGSFDLELSLKLEPVRSLGPPDKVDSSSREYRELIAYLKENLGFEQYVAQTIRAANKKSKENLEREYKLAVEEINKLEKWATENLLDPRAAKIAKLKAEFNSVELEKTDTLIVDEFLLKIAALKESLKPKDNAPENTQVSQAQKNNNEVQNNQDSEIKVRLRGFIIEEVVKEYGDGFDNFLAPRNFTLVRVSLSFDSFGQEVTIDGDRLYLITENGQRISPSEEATNAYLAQIGGKNIKFKDIEISKKSITLVFIIPISEKSNENLKLIYDEKPN